MVKANRSIAQEAGQLKIDGSAASTRPGTASKKMPDAFGASGKPLSEEKLTMALTTAQSYKHLPCQLHQFNLINQLPLFVDLFGAPQQSKTAVLGAEAVPN